MDDLAYLEANISPLIHMTLFETIRNGYSADESVMKPRVQIERGYRGIFITNGTRLGDLEGCLFVDSEWV